MAKVLVAVLDWGLGHAARSSRIIQLLTNQNHEVIIASGGAALQFLKSGFPILKSYELPGYNVRYSKHKILLAPALMLSFPGFLKSIKEEHNILRKIISAENISLVISDNRYGCYNAQVHSIFICHQLTIPLHGLFRPFRNIVALFHARLIKKFDAVWVPDFPDRRFSGLMGVCPGLSPKYIGILSRFSSCPTTTNKQFFITAIISGPDPLRARLVTKLEQILSDFNLPCLLIIGMPGADKAPRRIKNLTILSHADTAQMQQIICSSEFLIARSGYTSLMDFAITGSRVLFIPTPGQPEQEYIADQMLRLGMATRLNENELTRNNIEHSLKNLQPLSINTDNNLSDNFLRALVPITNPQ
jgi:hypothetical protein